MARRRPPRSPPASGIPAEAPELQALRQAAIGLLYPSESDTPLKPFAWRGEGLRSAHAAVESHAGGGQVDEVAVNAFFADLDAVNESERSNALRAVVTSRLTDVHVYRVGAGERRVDVYLVGRAAAGDWVGLRTQSIET